MSWQEQFWWGGGSVTLRVPAANPCRLDLWAIDMLFVVGGIRAGGMVSAIRRKCSENDVLTSVVAVPKSIDNDFLLVRPALAGSWGGHALCCAVLWRGVLGWV